LRIVIDEGKKRIDTGTDQRYSHVHSDPPRSREQRTGDDRPHVKVVQDVSLFFPEPGKALAASIPDRQTASEIRKQ